jgi:hypothetical protein
VRPFLHEHRARTAELSAQEEFSLLISETLFASIRVFRGVLPTRALVSIRVHSWLVGG